TGNTCSKISLGITDTPVTMAAKAHLRNAKPLIIAIATNDALGISAKNIGVLQSTKNVYFVPYGQDDPIKKATSIVAHFDKILDTLNLALDLKQIQPILAQ
ncbi:MAG: flavoprotein, partial [Clostridia bacterium]